jgi:hypothetical protein
LSQFRSCEFWRQAHAVLFPQTRGDVPEFRDNLGRNDEQLSSLYQYCCSPHGHVMRGGGDFDAAQENIGVNKNAHPESRIMFSR